MNEFYEWNYDYPKLVWESDFQFSGKKPQPIRKLIENSSLSFMDLDRIIYERDIGTVDKHIDTVINYIIEPTDVLILDKSFVKIFRLAQLAIEYLLCCKRHLDTNVAILKNELIKLQQENERVREQRMIDESKIIDFKRKIRDLKKAITVYSKNNSTKGHDCMKMTDKEVKLKEGVQHGDCNVDKDKERDDSNLARIQIELQSLKLIIENSFLPKNEEQRVLDELDAAIEGKALDDKTVQTEELNISTRDIGTQSDTLIKPTSPEIVPIIPEDVEKGTKYQIQDMQRLESHLQEIMSKLQILESCTQTSEGLLKSDDINNTNEPSPIVLKSAKTDDMANLTSKLISKVKKDRIKDLISNKENESRNSVKTKIERSLQQKLSNFGIDPNSKSITKTIFRNKMQFITENRHAVFEDMNEYNKVHEKLSHQINSMCSQGKHVAIYKQSVTEGDDRNFIKNHKKVIFEDNF